MFGAGDEIIEDVLFFEFHPGFVPFFTVFATAAKIGHHVDAAHVEPGNRGRRVGGEERDVEPAIGVEEGGVVAIKLESFAMDDEHGDAGAVLRGGEDLVGLVVVLVEERLGCLEEFVAIVGDIVAIGRSG